jgi:hypothetical protein
MTTMKHCFHIKKSVRNHLFSQVVLGGSETGTTPVLRTTCFASGPKDWSYSPKERGEKETKLSLLPRTPCRSFKRLHSAGLKKQKPRAGVATNFTMEVATS